MPSHRTPEPAAAGSASRHPHYEDDADVRARWDSDLMHFNVDVSALEKFFDEILDGDFPDDAAIMKRATPLGRHAGRMVHGWL